MRRLIALLASLALAFGLVVFVSPSSASAATGPVNVQQTFKVAPFSRAIKTSNGPYGTGWKETVKPGKTAKRYVYSVWIPAHCVYQFTYAGFNFTRRNDRNKGRWSSSAAMPHGRNTARIICR